MDAHNIASDSHNVTADTFSQTPNTQGYHANAILTSEKLDTSDDLAEMLKDFTINDAGYYVSDSANANDAKGDPASDTKTFTRTSDRKKINVTDTSIRILQQKLLSNWTLLIVTTAMDPRIDNWVATCGGTPHLLATPMTKKVITNATRRNAQVKQTPRHLIQTGRYGSTPGNTPHTVRSLRDNSPVLELLSPCRQLAGTVGACRFSINNNPLPLKNW